MTNEEKLKKATEFNKGWNRLAPGIYRNGQWGISRRKSGYVTYRGVCEDDLVLPQGFDNKTHKTLNDAKAAINTFEWGNNYGQ